LDESGFAHDMPRTHGYSAKGQLVFRTQDWNAKGRTNAIGAIIGGLIQTVMLFATNIDADVFITGSNRTHCQNTHQIQSL
jgi:hypothetical protein